MDIQKQIIFIIVLLSMVCIVEGMDCEYDKTPLIKDTIKWTCTNITGEYCISYVKYNQTLIQTNPAPKYISGVGLVDKFVVDNGIANIYFKKDLLRDDKNLTFYVDCATDQYNASVQPQFKDAYLVIDRTIWLRENMGYILGWLFSVIIISFFLIFGVILARGK